MALRCEVKSARLGRGQRCHTWNISGAMSASAKYQCHEIIVWYHSVRSGPMRQVQNRPNPSTLITAVARSNDTAMTQLRLNLRSRRPAAGTGNPRRSERAATTTFHGLSAISAQAEMRCSSNIHTGQGYIRPYSPVRVRLASNASSVPFVKRRNILPTIKFVVREKFRTQLFFFWYLVEVAYIFP